MDGLPYKGLKHIANGTPFLKREHRPGSGGNRSFLFLRIRPFYAVRPAFQVKRLNTAFCTVIIKIK